MGFGKSSTSKERKSDTNADSIKENNWTRNTILVPFYTKDLKYSRGQLNSYCKKCHDGSFELLENKKHTGKCCRCGDKF